LSEREKKILEMLPRFKKIRESVAEWYGTRKKDKRLSDLFVKIHHFNKDVQVPIPNVYAISEIDRLYGSIEKVDFNNPKHLAEVLVILENQQDPKFDFLPEQERQELRVKRMQAIPMAQVQNYVLAIRETFYGLKKNGIQKEREILEQTLALLDGAKLSSTSAKKQASK
jgi:hypothetical protein